MLLTISELKKKPPKNQTETFAYDNYFPKHVSFIGEPWAILSKHIGKIEKGSVVNFWTFGRYAMADILNYILRQTGAASVNACTWAITVDAVNVILNRMKDGLITDFKLWIDPRVRVRNPEPLQMCMANFPVAIKPIHAKVCTIGNAEWKISVSGSMNFTSNPQPERGIIQCIDSVFDADYQIIENEFLKSITN